jgi:tetratricopeptide (TPR) repeat protein
MKRKAKLLLAVALYTFLGMPVTPALAQGVKVGDDAILPDLAENPSAESSDAATGNLTLLGWGVEAYESGEYLAALEYLNKGLEQEGNTKEQLVNLHKYKALVLLAQNQPEAAKVEFVEALKLDPMMSLDPQTHSPKIMDTFQNTKNEFLPYLKSADQLPPTIKHTPFIGKVIFREGIEIGANIQDNYGVSRPELFYRNRGDLAFESVPLQDMGNGEYVGVVPATSVTGTEVEYYLVAQDVAGNVSYAGTLEKPNRVALVANPELKPWYKKWWVWGIVAGVAAAGAGAGIAMGGGGGGNGSQKTTDVTVVIPPP